MTSVPTLPSILSRPDGTAIAYQSTPARPGTSRPGILFLSGYASDMQGTKASALGEWAAARGQAMTRFDYFGHGQSSGAMRDGSIGRWRDDALTVFDELTAGPQILVGSSMGGWIMLLLALARPERVAGLVGIASAPDFTEDLMWNLFSAEVQERILSEGAVHMPSNHGDAVFEISREFIEEGRQHLLLRAPIAIASTVRLLHGMADSDVPWRTSLRLLERLTSTDATLTLIKDGDHRLSRPRDLARIFAAVAEVSAQ
jgi:pimeloyl-ACP methyl ester carboxylesterase